MLAEQHPGRPVGRVRPATTHSSTPSAGCARRVPDTTSTRLSGSDPLLLQPGLIGAVYARPIVGVRRACVFLVLVGHLRKAIPAPRPPAVGPGLEADHCSSVLRIILMLTITSFRPTPVLVAMALAALAAGCSRTPSAPESAAERPVAALEPPDRCDLDRRPRRPRLAVTYDGGVLVLRAATTARCSPARSCPTASSRLNPAGDDRHAFVSAAPGGFTALDLGAWTTDHGDHGHS